MDQEKKSASCKPCKPRVINIGLPIFYDALIAQQAKAVQISYKPPVQKSKEMEDILGQLL